MSRAKERQFKLSTSIRVRPFSQSELENQDQLAVHMWNGNINLSGTYEAGASVIKTQGAREKLQASYRESMKMAANEFPLASSSSYDVDEEQEKKIETVNETIQCDHEFWSFDGYQKGSKGVYKDSGTGRYASQHHVHHHLSGPLLDAVMDGTDCSMLVGGYAGTGKWFTGVGTTDDHGIFLLIGDALFDRMATAKQYYKAYVSMVEINAGRLQDLLYASDDYVGSFLDSSGRRKRDRQREEEEEEQLWQQDRAGLSSAGDESSEDQRATLKFDGHNWIIDEHKNEDEQQKTTDRFHESNEQQQQSSNTKKKKGKRKHKEKLKYTRVQVYDTDDVIRCIGKGCSRRSEPNGRVDKTHLVLFYELHLGAQKARSSSYYSKLACCILGAEEDENLPLPDELSRLQTNSINKSLSVLSFVIESLCNQVIAGRGIHIPYRDSTLTWLLKDTLDARSYVVYIACISPAQSELPNSLRTLRCFSRFNRVRSRKKEQVKSLKMASSAMPSRKSSLDSMHETEHQVAFGSLLEPPVGGNSSSRDHSPISTRKTSMLISSQKRRASLGKGKTLRKNQSQSKKVDTSYTYYRDLIKSAGPVVPFSRSLIVMLRRIYVEMSSVSDRMDIDHFKGALSSLGMGHLVERESLLTEQLFQKFNLSRNDQVEFDEFLFGLAMVLPSTLHERDDEAQMVWRCCFKLFDANKDGLLSKSDMKFFLGEVLSPEEDVKFSELVEKHIEHMYKYTDDEFMLPDDFKKAVMNNLQLRSRFLFARSRETENLQLRMSQGEKMRKVQMKLWNKKGSGSPSLSSSSSSSSSSLASPYSPKTPSGLKYSSGSPRDSSRSSGSRFPNVRDEKKDEEKGKETNNSEGKIALNSLNKRSTPSTAVRYGDRVQDAEGEAQYEVFCELGYRAVDVQKAREKEERKKKRQHGQFFPPKFDRKGSQQILVNLNSHSKFGNLNFGNLNLHPSEVVQEEEESGMVPEGYCNVGVYPVTTTVRIGKKKRKKGKGKGRGKKGRRGKW